ncbi:MAG: COQ9 family protein [Defluviicoccus sp.]|nr:COQ9 family protein [Defluviicoccus sp.]MDE0386606.1 COQ9 family protein [Defluviicoccus sp.]
MSGGGDAGREVRDLLVLAAVRHAASEGWTAAAIRAGAGELGIDAVDAERILRGGPRTLFRALNDWADERMAAAVGGASRSRLSERVETAMLARFDALLPWRESVARGVAFAAMPQNTGLGFACHCRTVDRMWRACGDRSHDFSFYTKRAILAGILAATTLVWLEDRSADGAATRAFLRRRLANVARIGRLRGRAERLADGLTGLARRPSVFHRGRRPAL